MFYAFDYLGYGPGRRAAVAPADPHHGGAETEASVSRFARVGGVRQVARWGSQCGHRHPPDVFTKERLTEEAMR
jgi:hypothetical protein